MQVNVTTIVYIHDQITLSILTWIAIVPQHMEHLTSSRSQRLQIPNL